MNQSAFALALSLGLVAAHGAQAQLLDASTGIRLETGTSIGTGAPAMPLLDATTSVDADVNGNAGTGLSGQATSTGTAGAALSFNFDRKGVAEGTQYSVDDASSVQTAAGLESYAASSVKDDERLQSAELSDGNLTVSYRTDAKLLGFIPASIKVTATVDADGNVSVRYPWYAFFMPTYESRADLETRLTKEQASIKDELAAAGTLSVGGEASAEARAWALMLERLRSSLYATASAEARR